VNSAIADRLANQGIQVLSEGDKVFLFARDTCVALVERREAGIGSIGSTGVMTETGLAYLVWRGGQAMLVGKAGEQAAADAQVEAIRRFSADLKAALGV
jgi:hypothetical protein